MLGIQFRDIKKSERKMVEQDIAVEEEMMKKQGIAYRKLILSTNFLDNYSYQIEVISESLLQPSKSKKQIIMKDKLQIVASIFPEIMMANQVDFFKMALDAYDDKDASKYIRNYKMMQQAQQQAAMAEAGQPRPEVGQNAGQKPQQSKPANPKQE